MKKVIRNNFTKFTVKCLCQSLFFTKVAGVSPWNCFYEKRRDSWSSIVKSLISVSLAMVFRIILKISKHPLHRM